MDVNYGNTIGLGRDVRTCFVYDNRRFCQTVLQTQNILFGVTPDVCSSDLITAGDFPDASSTANAWSRDPSALLPLNGWAWTSGYIRHVTGNTITVHQNNILTAGRFYRVTLTVGRYVNQFVEIEGSVSVYFGTTLVGTITQSGTYTFYGEADDHYLAITPSIDFDGYLDDISMYVYPAQAIAYAVDADGNPAGTPFQLAFVNGTFWCVTTYASFELDDGCYTICVAAQCDYIYDNLVTNGAFTGNADGWTLGTNWSYGANQVCHAGLGAGLLSQTLSNLLANKTYTVRFTVSSRTAGSVDVSLGGSAVQTISANGAQELTFTTPDPLANNDIKFQADGTFDGCIDDVQVILAATSYPSDFCSACLSLQTDPADCQVLISYTNPKAAFGVDYPSWIGHSPEYINQIYVRAYLRIPTWDEDETDFRSSSGTKSKTYFRTEKMKELFIEHIPEYLCDALSIAKGHKNFYIDGVEYYVLGGFDPDGFTDSPESLLSTVKLNVRKKTFLMENKNC